MGTRGGISSDKKAWLFPPLKVRSLSCDVARQHKNRSNRARSSKAPMTLAPFMSVPIEIGRPNEDCPIRFEFSGSYLGSGLSLDLAPILLEEVPQGRRMEPGFAASVFECFARDPA